MPFGVLGVAEMVQSLQQAPDLLSSSKQYGLKNFLGRANELQATALGLLWHPNDPF